jgi:hypothetical protein
MGVAKLFWSAAAEGASVGNCRRNKTRRPPIRVSRLPFLVAPLRGKPKSGALCRRAPRKPSQILKIPQARRRARMGSTRAARLAGSSPEAMLKSSAKTRAPAVSQKG